MAEMDTSRLLDEITPEFIERLRLLEPWDIAEYIRFYTEEDIRLILRELPDELTAEVITELPKEIQIWLFEQMRPQRLSGIIQEMFSDDAADLLGQISLERLQQIMAALEAEDAREIADLLRYPEDTAGGIMQAEYLSVDWDATLAEAREELRSDRDYDDDGIFYVYVTDDFGRLQGVISMRDLLFRRPELKVRDVMSPEVRCVSVYADQEEIASLFRKYHYVGVPVVDDFGRLRGLVTSDDVMEVVDAEATEDMHRMVGLTGEEMIDTPWATSLKHRLPWLFLNLGTAFLAAWVISLFERTLEEYAMLAIFLPIVAGQGGNAGTQTLTIVVRGIALGEVQDDDQRRILVKELMIGFFSGLATGAAVGLISFLWKGSVVLGVVIGLAMIFNMLAAAIAGVIVPLGLRAMKVDPALASAIMVTTVTDVVGFFVFLGFATSAIAILPQGFFPT